MKALSIAAALLAGSLSIGTAEAMPMGSINVQSNIVKADYACGRGWHLTPWGECRRNWQRPPMAFYGGPPRWGWDGPRWRHERRWDRDRRWNDDRRWYGDRRWDRDRNWD
ncbi:hypothetical protein NE852_13930 [Rhizobium sp. Pop5]|uniref:GCG_CRPN prefix-to-repeats domain-containing protein n=1 Tax=Rhizobium sp. Pop5 TaxID=1223565 RepID=UPI00028398B9|nr:hypothetical protein [Rhizobium sp. Pop5]EJZ18041.1 hypothetical protein RCCGEPOP_27639 [Rhizobium sp. Pop5]UVD55203.1 hypothetical protein NE852_13930 [Rhizobium sp. Pop5]